MYFNLEHQLMALAQHVLLVAQLVQQLTRRSALDATLAGSLTHKHAPNVILMH